MKDTITTVRIAKRANKNLRKSIKPRELAKMKESGISDTNNSTPYLIKGSSVKCSDHHELHISDKTVPPFKIQFSESKDKFKFTEPYLEKRLNIKKFEK